jgi:hypothetical protein
MHVWIVTFCSKTNLKNYLFKQSRGSLYAASITAESLCPTSLQCTYLGRAVCLWPVTLRSVRTKFATQVSGAYIYWRVVKKQYIWTFALNLTNSQGRQYVMSKRLKENQTNNTVLRTEITFQVLNKYVVAVIIRMETYKNIE